MPPQHTALVAFSRTYHPSLLPSAYPCPLTRLISNLFLERTLLTLTIALESPGCSFLQVPLRRRHDQNYHQEEHLTFGEFNCYSVTWETDTKHRPA